MSDDHDQKRKKIHYHQDNKQYFDEEDDSEEGGKSGQIEFKDFTASEQYLRDDLLPADIKKRLLSTHKDVHELRVKQQKDVRDQRAQLKSGKISRTDYQHGVMQTGSNTQYLPFPAFANKAQFSGMERQVSPLSNQHVSDANEAERNELENQHRLRYSPQRTHQPPKPQYR